MGISRAVSELLKSGDASSKAAQDGVVAVVDAIKGLPNLEQWKKASADVKAHNAKLKQLQGKEKKELDEKQSLKTSFAARLSLEALRTDIESLEKDSLSNNNLHLVVKKIDFFTDCANHAKLTEAQKETFKIFLRVAYQKYLQDLCQKLLDSITLSEDYDGAMKANINAMSSYADEKTVAKAMKDAGFQSFSDVKERVTNLVRSCGPYYNRVLRDKQAQKKSDAAVGLDDQYEIYEAIMPQFSVEASSKIQAKINRFFTAIDELVKYQTKEDHALTDLQVNASHFAHLFGIMNKQYPLELVPDQKISPPVLDEGARLALGLRRTHEEDFQDKRDKLMKEYEELIKKQNAAIIELAVKFEKEAEEKEKTANALPGAKKLKANNLQRESMQLRIEAMTLRQYALDSTRIARKFFNNITSQASLNEISDKEDQGNELDNLRVGIQNIIKDAAERYEHRRKDLLKGLEKTAVYKNHRGPVLRALKMVALNLAAFIGGAVLFYLYKIWQKGHLYGSERKTFQAVKRRNREMAQAVGDFATRYALTVGDYCCNRHDVNKRRAKDFARIRKATQPAPAAQPSASAPAVGAPAATPLANLNQFAGEHAPEKIAPKAALFEPGEKRKTTSYLDTATFAASVDATLQDAEDLMKQAREAQARNNAPKPSGPGGSKSSS